MNKLIKIIEYIIISKLFIFISISTISWVILSFGMPYLMSLSEKNVIQSLKEDTKAAIVLVELTQINNKEYSNIEGIYSDNSGNGFSDKKMGEEYIPISNKNILDIKFTNCNNIPNSGFTIISTNFIIKKHIIYSSCNKKPLFIERNNIK